MLIRHEFISGLLCEILSVVFSLVDGLLVLVVEPIVHMVITANSLNTLISWYSSGSSLKGTFFRVINLIP